MNLLHSELPEDWEIYIQPHMNGLEPDFVVMHPRCGIAVFEVKDWNFGAMDYQYQGPPPVLTAEHHGVRFRVMDDPIAKAVTYKAEIFDLYCPSMSTPAHFGIITTGVLFTNASRREIQRVFVPDALRDLGFEDREQYVLASREDLSAGKLTDWFPRVNKESTRMSPEVMNELRRWLIQPSFDAEQMIPLRLHKSRMRFVTGPKARTKSGYRRLKGSSGSGKSCVLASRAAELSLLGKQVLVVTFNITLVNYLRDLAARYARRSLKGSITWLNYHRWAKRVCMENGRAADYRGLWTHGKDHALRVGLPSLVDRVLREGGKYAEHYDAILVDEGQDYRLEWWSNLRLARKNGGEMLLVADPTQNLYGTSRAWTEGAMTTAGFPGGDWARLEGSYRLPNPLIDLARKFGETFMPDDEYRILPDTRQQELQVDPVQLRWLQVDPEDATNVCVREVFRLPNLDPKCTFAWSDVVFLTTSKTVGGAVVDKLQARGFRVLHTFFEDESRERKAKLAFFKGDARLKATTVHSFKGWECRAVVAHLSQMDDPKRVAAAYAALTRLKSDPRGSCLTVVCDWGPFAVHGYCWPTFFDLSRADGLVDNQDRLSAHLSEPATIDIDDSDFDLQWLPLVRALAAQDSVEVEAGDEVVENGRVIDLYLAAVSRGERTLYLVDDAERSAEGVTRALQRQGKRTLRVRPDDEALAELILEELK